jgi:hypothetical protein
MLKVHLAIKCLSYIHMYLRYMYLSITSRSSFFLLFSSAQESD